MAAYILKKKSSMSAMKLQKLVYYSQAWHLVWEERPLFSERIEAWANGPVSPDLYAKHRRQFMVSDWSQWGNSDNLDAGEKASIDNVLGFYGERPAHELSELTHREDPWRNARGDLPAGANCRTEISHVDIHEYYDGLVGTNPL
ncbi:type II toxin-antitoxin system antitoxin SocA domain-containing protein [Arthrobacter sp. Bi83]|uniref:Panacea domain-containing protein n=1 Tax=Arthrobacter sp. Bi83 TaxID=2822353 RepID=UPI001E38E2F0|nr:type II toxin-antitoxin system antitoxin SocA domain-containing protein [Arthrobacter sp. Bi83]